MGKGTYTLEVMDYSLKDIHAPINSETCFRYIVFGEKQRTAVPNRKHLLGPLNLYDLSEWWTVVITVIYVFTMFIAREHKTSVFHSHLISLLLTGCDSVTELTADPIFTAAKKKNWARQSHSGGCPRFNPNKIA